MTRSIQERTGLQSGQTLHHYRILSRIDSDEPGELYRAEDLRHTRTVAVRILPETLIRDGETRERYVQGVRAASALDHPNICAVADIAETDDGRVFVAMVCYTGETIHEKLHRGPLTVELSIAIARQMAEGLAIAHDHGIIHSHLNPSSIMVTDDGVVKMLDFGLPQESSGRDEARVSGETTPEYRAPEQLHGDRPDERSDIWTFGVILYEMLTGIIPFRGGDPSGRMATIVAEDLAEPAALRAEVPGSLSHLCRRCLQSDPHLRPQSMSEVQSLLGHWPFEVTTEGQPFWNRVRGRYIALGVGLLIVLTALMVLLFSR
jgi:serine/threonine protein kinase